MAFDFVDALDCGLAVFAADGRIVAWNKWLAAHSAIAAAEAIGRRIDELDPGLVGGRLVEALSEAAAHGMSGFMSYQLAHRFLALKDPVSGKALRQNITIKPLHLSPELGRGALMQVFDATRSAEREDRLRAHERGLAVARNVAEEADRAKTRFLATMSHEIRTPLSGIVAIAGLLEEAKLGDPAANHVATLTRSAESLMRIVNDVLDLSSLTADRLELIEAPFDPRELLEGALALVAPRAKTGGLTLELRIDGALPAQLTGDFGRLRQVLLNLLTNSVKFTRTGFVRLEACVRPAQDGRLQLEAAVVDSGPGIAAAARERLFVAFAPGDAQLARLYGGTGLGLSICRALIERMGGTIGYTPLDAGGSRFWFQVPLAAIAGAAGAAAASDAIAALLARLATVKARLQRRIAVLLAEDNSVNSMVFAAILPADLFELRIVEDGIAAVAAASSTAFDLILMDVGMPGMDGHEATRQLRAKGIATPIVALTANAFASDRAAATAAGMDSFLPKPFRKHELLGIVADTLAG
jgi:two-component system, sensor histidine kinase